MRGLNVVDPIETRVLDRIRQQLGETVTYDALQRIELSTLQDAVAARFVHVLSRSILATGKGPQVATEWERVPATAWDHVKLELLQRWPFLRHVLARPVAKLINVRYETHYDRVCPHHDVGDGAPHVRFMTMGDDVLDAEERGRQEGWDRAVKYFKARPTELLTMGR